jgi:hypothetical protein
VGTTKYTKNNTQIFIKKEETMDAKTLVKVLRQVVREEVRSVIKEELTEILKDGLQPTINEMTNGNTTPSLFEPTTSPGQNKRKTQFKKTGFADILNETESLREQSPYGNAMNENISMTSADVHSFGAVRKKMHTQMLGIETPSVIQDPETGRNLQVNPVIAQAMTRDYSALMKAMDNRKGKG